MNITVNRKWFTSQSTIGEMLIDGVFFSYTLEDMVRPAGVKVFGETAIPAGTYKVVIDQSTRFKRLMPHVLDVPGFDGIRIHNGNTAADTEGCILLGATKSKDFVGNSKTTFDKFFSLLQEKLKTETATITIINAKEG